MLAHESAMARMERIIHRLWALVIIIFLALIITNGAWIYYESQFEVVEETTTDEVIQRINADDGNEAVITGIGDIDHGGSGLSESKTDNYEALSQKEEEVND